MTEQQKKLCTEEGCAKTAYQKKLCWTHYRRYLISMDPDYLKKEAARRKRHREENPELDRRSRQRWLARHYGLPLEVYERMVELCEGQCHICEDRPEPIIRYGRPVNALCVDHDHDTGKVRGLLCRKCNSAIAYFKECPAILLAAVDYLVKHGKPDPDKHDKWDPNSAAF